MTYIVSTNTEGRKRWWHFDEGLPPGERGIRPATEAESVIMDEILRQDAAGYMPDDVLGEKLREMMASN